MTAAAAAGQLPMGSKTVEGRLHLKACGLIGEATAPSKGMGAAEKKNSYGLAP